MRTNTPSTDQMNFLSRHVPVSVSICSNVEGFSESKCFVDISYLNHISSANLSRLKLQYEYVFYELEELMEKYSTGVESNEESSDSTSSESTNKNSLFSKAKTHFLTRIVDLRRDFETYLSQIPVIGFNSGKYDINKGMGWYLDKNTKLRGILLYILVNANGGNGRDVPNMS